MSPYTIMSHKMDTFLQNGSLKVSKDKDSSCEAVTYIVSIDRKTSRKLKKTRTKLSIVMCFCISLACL